MTAPILLDRPSPPAIPPAETTAKVRETLALEHFLFLPGSAMRTLLASAGSLDDFTSFQASWDRLEIDTHMADRGRYRRRRHAVFEATANGHFQPLPARAHYQSRDYNPVNGGIARWFSPVETEVVQSDTLGTILRWCCRAFLPDVPGDGRWDVEVHQFRIEARAGHVGHPTPEGVHRDGVDHVLVLMIRRVNIASGTTSIRSDDDRLLDSFTLTDPFDAAVLDDRKVYHGVTPVEPLDAAQPAFRDVLVVTFRARSPA
jgi:hypothetical protein